MQSDQPLNFKTRRRLMLATALLLLLAASVVLLIHYLPATIAPRAQVERYLTRKFHRPVQIGAIKLSLRDPLVLELDDLHFKNADWGSAPDMLHIEHFTTEIDVLPLLKGTVQLHHATLDGATLVLERDEQGVGNWKFAYDGEHPPAKIQDSAADIRQREQLPTMFDLAVHHSHITFRTSNHALLKFDFNNLTIATTAPDQPVKLLLEGAYNEVPVQLDVTAQSFDALHDISQPFGAVITAKGAGATVQLDAKMTDPLNFEGVTAQLALEIKRLDAVGPWLGEKFQLNAPLQLAGALQRDGDVWQLHEASGKLSTYNFAGQIQLTEGARLQPDDLKLKLHFTDFDIDRFLRLAGKAKDNHKIPLQDVLPPKHVPNILLDAQLGFTQLNYHQINVRDLGFHALIAPDMIKLDDLTLRLNDGKLTVDLSVKAVEKNSQFKAGLKIQQFDIGKTLALAQAGSAPLTGRFDVTSALSATGNTPDQLKQTLDGYLLLTMTQGQIEKRAIQLASINLAGAFTKTQEQSQLTCLLGVMSIRHGIGFLDPLWLKTNDGTLFGGGQINLPTATLDLTFKTERNSTGALALDLPIHLVGKISDPHAVPKLNSAVAGLKLQSAGNFEALPTVLRKVVQATGCLER